eukprot:jgi/Tetstr1/461926/TSEL_007004.t1
MAARVLVVLTLNIWGLLHVSKRRAERVVELGRQLEFSNADVVALQEVWVRTDAEYLRARAAAGGHLRHSHLFESGLFGPGLLVLSRHPITETSFYPFEVLGDPAKILGGDYFGSKGVGSAKLRVSDPQPGRLPVEVTLLVTHTHANYKGSVVPLLLRSAHGSEGAEQTPERVPEEPRSPVVDTGVRVPTDDDAGIRTSNLVQLGQIAARAASAPGARVVVAGDLNSLPGSLEIGTLRQLAPCLRDTWAETQPSLDGFTCNTRGNSWSSPANRPVRIDYVWSNMQPLGAALVDNRTEAGHSVSDHLGVVATLDLDSGGGPQRCGDGGAVMPSANPEVPARLLQKAIWNAAAERAEINLRLLQSRRSQLLWLSLALACLGLGLFLGAFWTRSALGAWDDIWRRRLFESHKHRPFDRDKGFLATQAGSSCASRRLRALFIASAGMVSMLVAGALWLLGFLALTGQIRSMEAAHAGMMFLSSAS